VLDSVIRAAHRAAMSLDRAMWLAFDGPQRHLTVGDHRARRFAAGFSPIIIFPDRTRPDFEAIEAHCEPGEQFYVEGWDGPAPAGWQIHSETFMTLMTWRLGADIPDPPTLAHRDLDAADVASMLELVGLTNPGPFGPRTRELGDYVGVFDGDRLVSMAGERFHLPGHREISGVCTHPAHRGRGYARALMSVLIRRQLERGERPFLHVMLPNRSARELYARMGFIEYHTMPVRVLQRHPLTLAATREG
jgi:GNAT superfamily N-acetyltransferase